jgi:hypothetical protein
MCKYNENLKQQIYFTLKQCEQKAVGIVPYNSTNSSPRVNDIIQGLPLDIIGYMSDILSKLLSSHLLRLSQAHFSHVSAIDSSIVDYHATSDLESMECMTPETEDSDSNSM